MKSKKIVLSSMLIAISIVLSLIQPFQLPFGGGITLASMMPIVLIAFIFGTKWGLLCAFVYSLLQIVTGFKTVAAFFIPGDSQMTLFAAIAVCTIDYILAYTALGFGGIFKNKIKNDALAITAGAIFATTLRYVLHIVSGAVFFGSWAHWFFSQEGFYAVGEVIVQKFSGTMLSILYSIFYNGLYMIPEIVITAIITPIIYNMLKKSKSI